MSTTVITLDVPNASLEAIDEIAKNLGSDRQAVFTEALASYLKCHAALIAEVEEAERQINAGNYLTQAQMESRFEAQLSQSKAA